MRIDIEGLRKLSNEDKLKIVELLWDDIAASEEPIKLQPWQFEEAMRRDAELKADPSIAIDRDELWRESMDRLVRIHPRMVEDLESSTQWYDNISRELGNRFRKAVNSRLDAVQNRPKSFGRAFGDLRAAQVPGFPYLIAFTCEEQLVNIEGLFHSSSDQSNWQRSS